MIRKSIHAIAGAALAASLLASSAMAGEKNMAHVHIGHVTTSWADTPDARGLLPVAEVEAAEAARHVGLAAKKTGDLGWMKTHAAHVLHIVDPAREPKGPGLGYGLAKAAQGVARHIGLASASEGASQAVKIHAVHVAASAENTAARAKALGELAVKVKGAGSAAEAAALVAEMSALAAQLSAGRDANGDGTVTWEEGEGGLAALKQHLGFILDAEGLS